jgi:Tol biopolymer transport system component
MDDTDVRELLHQVADVPGPDTRIPLTVVRRVRRRRMIAVGTALVAVCLIGVVTVAGTRALLSSDAARRPAHRPVQPAPTALGALAYVLNGDIYVAEGDGSNPVRIADGRPEGDCVPGGSGEYWAEGPMWSPDGRYLAFRHTNCQDASKTWKDVVISDPEGNVVASFPSEGWQISWSPDSTRLAVWVVFEKTIGVYGLDGVRQKVLTVPARMMAGGDFDPVWSPDGASLWVPFSVEVPLDGSAPRQLPPDDPRAQDAAYSADGSRAAYVASNGSLVVAAAEGSHAREVIDPGVPGRLMNPVLSPTGDRIVFRYAETPVFPHGSELRVIDVATGTVTSLVGKGGSDFQSVIEFSPDGDQILFYSTTDGGRGATSLWSVHADGSDPRLLVSGTDRGDWQPVSRTR